MENTKVAPLRTVLTWIIGALAMVVIALATMLVSHFNDPMRDKAHNCAGLWGKLILWLSGVNVIVQGEEYLDKNNPQVLIANHQGSFDIWGLAARLPVQFRWVVKKELFNIPTLGGAMRAAGDLSIDRFNPRQAIKDIKQGLVRLAQGRSILIFPEGTRTLDGDVGEFKPGAFLLALKSKTPIVPISIQGSYQIMRKNSIWLYPQTIWVKIHPPIETKDLSRQEQKELPEKVRQVVIKGVKSSGK